MPWNNVQNHVVKVLSLKVPAPSCDFVLGTGTSAASKNMIASPHQVLEESRPGARRVRVRV